MLLPLVSEVSILGVGIKRQLDDFKNTVNEKLLDIRTDKKGKEIFSYIPGVALRINKLIKIIAYAQLRSSPRILKNYKDYHKYMLKARFYF